MKVFFQIKFSITAKEETQIEEELSNYVLTWLESKYGVLLSAPYLHVNRSCQIANSEIPMGCSLKRYITKM